MVRAKTETVNFRYVFHNVSFHKYSTNAGQVSWTLLRAHRGVQRLFGHEQAGIVAESTPAVEMGEPEYGL